MCCVLGVGVAWGSDACCFGTLFGFFSSLVSSFKLYVFAGCFFERLSSFAYLPSFPNFFLGLFLRAVVHFSGFVFVARFGGGFLAGELEDVPWA